jgi:hypothetical protein
MELCLKKQSKNLVNAFLVFFIFTSAVKADITIGNSLFGNNTVIYDQGLAFLSPTVTAGLSYNQVLTNLGQGAFSNLSFATSQQVLTLFQDSGHIITHNFTTIR